MAKLPLLPTTVVGSYPQPLWLVDYGALRNRLVAMGIRPGVELEVRRRGQPGGILHLAHGVMEFMLRRDHAAQIQTSPVQIPTAD
jgi:Fe2+ transport system protein FeoA